jgi:MATE family multidrug resistance protein
MQQGELLREARALMILGLPMIGSQVAQFSMHITNTMMLGRYSVESLAAATLGVTFFFIFFILCSAYAWAVMPMVAAANANGDDREVRRVTRMGFWLTTLAAVVVMPAFWFSVPILLALGQKPETAELAGVYLRVTGWSIFPATGVMMLRSYLGALERTQVVLWVTVGAAILNAFLNYAFIFGHWGAPELGLRGAAYVTAIVQGFSFLGLAVYVALHPAFRRHEIFVRFWRPDWGAFASVFRLGWPIGFTALAENGLFAATAFMMGWLGTTPLAAHGIALEIVAAFFMVHLGLSQAATVRAGRAHGRGDRAGLRVTAFSTYAVSLLVLIPTMALFLFGGGLLAGLFVAADDIARPEIIAAGTTLLAVAALFQFADAGQVLTLGLLRGVQDTRVPMVMAAVSYWGIGIPTGYALGFPMGYGGPGIWVGLVVGLAVAFGAAGDRRSVSGLGALSTAPRCDGRPRGTPPR